MKFNIKETEKFNIKIPATPRKRCSKSHVGETLVEEDGYLLIKQGGGSQYDFSNGASEYEKIRYYLFFDDNLIAYTEPGRRGVGFVKLVKEKIEAPKKAVQESAERFARAAIKSTKDYQLIVTNGVCWKLALADLMMSWSCQEEFIPAEHLREVFRKARKIVDQHFYPEEN